MKLDTGWILAAALAALCLLFPGCSGGGQETVSAQETAGAQIPAPLERGAFSDSKAGGGITMAAVFQRPNGRMLADGSVRISRGEASALYPLDIGGALCLSGLPGEGTVTLLLLDQNLQELGRTAVHFTRGAVIDASTDENGEGCVTLKEDTGYVALIFTLDGSGGLQCALHLET